MRDIKEQLVTSEIRKLAPVLGKGNTERLSRAYLIADEDTRKRIFELIDVMKAAVLSDKDMQDAILMEPAPRDVALKGDIGLGSVMYGRKKMYPLLIDQQAFLTHLAIFGSSGYGKTNISYSLIQQLAEKEVPVLVFDFSKRNYRDLLATPLKDKIEVYTIGRDVVPLKFNPLKPPDGISLSQWMKEFSMIFDHAYWLLGGGRHIILKALDAVHQQRKHPRLTDLKTWIDEYAESHLPARERNWLATAARPLDSLCFRELGEIFNTDTGVQPSDFFQKGKVTVLELDALSTNDRTFFIEIMLQWIRDWLLSTTTREQLAGVIILEEAHHILNREKSKKTGAETVTDLVFREVRELGMGIVYIDQHPSLVSYPALGNTSTHVYMNLGLDTRQSSDILDAANMLGLDYDEERNYLRKLPVGHGFVLCRSSAFPNPFVVQFAHFPIKKGAVTDEHLRTLMKGRIDRMLEEYQSTGEPVNEDIEQPRIDPRAIDEKGWSIITTLGEGRGVFTSQIYKFLGVSGKVFNQSVRRLIDQGLAGVREGKIGKNRMHYYFLTAEGLRLYQEKSGAAAKRYDIDLRETIDLMASLGWTYQPGEGRFTMGEGEKTEVVAMVLSTDREKIRKDVRTCRYFLCPTEKVRNMVIQEAARRAFDKTKAPVIYVTLLKTFQKNGRFEKVEIV